MKYIIPICFLAITGITNAFTYNLNVNFGFDANIANGLTGYLIADSSSDNSASLSSLSTAVGGFCAPTGSFTEGSYIGDSDQFQVISAAYTSSGNGFNTQSQFYDSVAGGWDTDITSGDTLAWIWTDGTTIWGFNDTGGANTGLGANVGWTVPNDTATNTLVDVSVNSGGDINFSDLSTFEVGKIGAVAVPEPTSSALLALGGLALVTRRRR